MNATPKKRGRPEVIGQEVRWKIRGCYRLHFGQWGPQVLRAWAIREGLGSYAAGTIAKVVADLKPVPEPKPKPRKYEITTSMVMWSIDATVFKDRGIKRELLVLQDERGRYKSGWQLCDRTATGDCVAKLLRQAFEKYGAPLILKHDGGSIFFEDSVQKLLREFGVVDLTSPPYYPQFNGKKERSMRDINSYVKALLDNHVGETLEERIELAMKDLNEDRPRPMLGGRTAAEVFYQNRTRLPDPRRFTMEVKTKQLELEPNEPTEQQTRSARRTAVSAVLSRYGFLKYCGNVSTNSQTENGTH
jgi:transposase InsO family protein